MRALTAAALLLALSAVAFARSNPGRTATPRACERGRKHKVRSELCTRTSARSGLFWSAGFIFGAPQPPFNASFPCRLELDLFGETRA